MTRADVTLVLYFGHWMHWQLELAVSALPTPCWEEHERAGMPNLSRFPRKTVYQSNVGLSALVAR